ncbi:MAG: hypothetical protein LIO92_10020 [Clostridiales bacterium]|nr:hypothetical protein [Clostridiales bacterium]
MAFEALSNKRYDALTPEMEIATYNAYKNAKNNDKQYFSDWFSRIWIDFRNIEDMDIQLTEESLKKLREDLNTLKRDYKEQKKNIAAKHTQRFIDEIDKLLEVEGAEGEGNEE